MSTLRGTARQENTGSRRRRIETGLATENTEAAKKRTREHISRERDSLSEEPKVDGESLRCNVVVIDKTLQRKAGENEESIPEPKRCAPRARYLDHFGCTLRCPGWVSMPRGTARQAQTERCRRRVETESGGAL